VLLSITGIAAFVLMTLTGNSALLLFAFFLTGINRGAVSNFNNTIVNEIATGKGWALNILHSIFAIGAFIAPFVSLAFVKDNPDGWKYAAITWAFLCLTEVLTYAFMNIPNNKPLHKEKKKMDWSFLKNKCYLTACCILFFYLCAEQAINGWLVTYFKESGILSGSFAQSMAGLLWVVILLGRLFSAYLSNKIRKTSLLLVNACGYVVFFVILLSSRTITPVIIGIIGVGFCMAGLYPTTIASIGKTIKEYPMALSFVLTFAGIGSILMPTIIGTVADNVGLIGGMSTVIVAVIITLICIIYYHYLYMGVDEI
jgi:fucose permease